MSEPRQPEPEVMNRLGALYRAGRHADLERECRALIARFADAPVLHQLLGAALAAQNKLEAAVESCRALIALRPDDGAAFSNLGFALFRLRRPEEALDACCKAVELDGRNAEAHNNLGVVLQSLGRAADAAASFRRAVALAPGHAGAHNNLAAALRDCGRPGEAEAACRRAIEIAPGHGAFHANLGSVLRALGRMEAALAACRRAVELMPGSAEAMNELGVTERAAGMDAAAEESYRRAIALDPENVEALNNLGNLLHDAGNDSEAATCYRRVVGLRPDHGPARHMLAALSGETTPTAPETYVRRLFDDYAHRFDAHLTEALGYDTPARLVSLLRATLPGRAHFARAADLGCGTGLSGVAFRSLAGWLAGIDLSGEMIAEAKRKKVYDELLTGGIVEMLAGRDDRFDLFVCTDVLIYVGDADAIFAAAAARASADAVFCVSTETHDGEGFVLRSTGRYAHADAYLERVAAHHGFALAGKADAVIRKGRSGPIPGRHFILRR